MTTYLLVIQNDPLPFWSQLLLLKIVRRELMKSTKFLGYAETVGFPEQKLETSTSRPLKYVNPKSYFYIILINIIDGFLLHCIIWMYISICNLLVLGAHKSNRFSIKLLGMVNTSLIQSQH